MKSPFSRLFGGTDKGKDKEQLPEEAATTSTAVEEVVHIPIGNIVPNKYQPRTVFDDSKIEELARTIRTHGIIQPIVLREIESGHYEIIAGERRFRAMSMLEWTEVPAIVRNLSDKETASVALIENLQREELTAIEEALAYQQLIELHELTQEALAQRLGKGQSTVANKIRLLKLPQQVQDAILTKELSERHARALMKVKDEPLQLELLSQTISEQLSVKQLEERIAALKEKAVEPNKKTPPKQRRKMVNKDVRIALNTLKQSLTMISKSGIDFETQEEDQDDYYQVVIKIPKRK
ncbi:nucleoid occlusion protein [Tetzosporium hominis]|uniref:Nucleoid occlusion protein n=1 Tax=Tetzosporium hominis TaxID=2020506 RepID=A0A264W5Y4_9BACL|nr:nucleoid occlusion protein [Tetzosporium hominis]OZS78992.1 nucleoid occlusion protein [Tetzosporium hominis]